MTSIVNLDSFHRALTNVKQRSSQAIKDTFLESRSTTNTLESVSLSKLEKSSSHMLLMSQVIPLRLLGKSQNRQLIEAVTAVFRFNSSQIPKADGSLHATSRRYGTRTMMDTAPNMQPGDYFTTTARASYLSPKTHDRPNYRTRDPNTTFENSAKLIIKPRSNTLASGYESNR